MYWACYTERGPGNLMNEQLAREAEEAVLEALSDGGKLTAREITERTGLGQRRVYRALKRLGEKGLVQKKGNHFFRLSKGGNNGTKDPGKSITIKELYALLLENFQAGLRDGYGGTIPHGVNVDIEFRQFMVRRLGLPPILPPSWRPDVRPEGAIEALSLAYTAGFAVGSQWAEKKHSGDFDNSLGDHPDYWALIFGCLPPDAENP